MQSESVNKPVFAIPCYVTDNLRKGVKKTLQQIQDKYPKDFLRLQKLVRAIQPYDDAEEGDVGIWKEDSPIYGNRATLDNSYGETPGVINLVEDIQIEDLPGILAHELGHAATRPEDLERRGPISDEWQSELAADWYAYKWGFGRHIARQRKNRAWLHHGPPPGSSFTVSYGDTVCHYRITRNFVAHLIEITRDSV